MNSIFEFVPANTGFLANAENHKLLIKFQFIAPCLNFENTQSINWTF